jgi:transposase
LIAGEAAYVSTAKGPVTSVAGHGAGLAGSVEPLGQRTGGTGRPCSGLLAVAEGLSYTAAAQLVGRHTGDTVARWITGFNDVGLAAVGPRHGGGHPVRYGEVEQRRILAEVARPPDRARDGTASWSLNTLRAALRRAEDGLPGVSTDTIGRILHAAGFSWQKSRTWCETGVVVRKRKQGGQVGVTDPDAAAKRG